MTSDQWLVDTAWVATRLHDPCAPHAVAEGSSDALGNQTGGQAIRAVAEQAGFRSFRRGAETPFNLVYEVPP